MQFWLRWNLPSIAMLVQRQLDRGTTCRSTSTMNAEHIYVQLDGGNNGKTLHVITVAVLFACTTGRKMALAADFHRIRKLWKWVHLPCQFATSV
jgi:hypothetical protein